MKRIFLSGLAVLAAAFCLQTNAGAAEFFSYDDYEYVLTKYVAKNGLVNYAGIKKDRTRLDKFVTQMAKLDAKTFNTLPRNQRLAFWINAYNALTLRGVIDHYPIESFRDVGGWFSTPQKKLTFTVMGESMNLDHIEHEILRKVYKEPRIHVAINCAAFDCPRLRNEVYIPEKLEAQLDDQSVGFVNHPKKFKIDTIENTVYLSKIFDWFGEDFVANYYKAGRFDDYSKEEQAVLNFAKKYGRSGIFDALDKIEFDIEYMDYNWKLNEQK